MSEKVPWLARLLAAWRHVAVVLIGIHVVAVFLHAMPSPGSGLRRADWDQPTVQGEFETWAGHLGGLGIEITSEELQDRVYVFAKGYQDGYAALTDPFKPYYRTCGTWQSWRMFVAPHKYPSKLQIRVRIDNRWVPVYEARSTVLTWRGYQLDHERMRAALFRYGWGRKYPGTWNAFARWIAREAAADFPQADQVNLRFIHYRTPSPEEVRAGEVPDVEYTRSVRFRLDEYR